MKPNTFVLPAGVEVWVRDLHPGDKAKLREGFEALSTHSRYLRFHAHGFNLNNAKLNYLTEIDQVNHVAIGVACVADGEELGVGVGRFIRMPEAGHEAELALTVRDAYQRQGVGALMLTALCKKAHAQGITHFIVHIHAQRTALIQRMLDMGAAFRRQSNGVAVLAMPVLTCKDLEASKRHHLVKIYQQITA